MKVHINIHSDYNNKYVASERDGLTSVGSRGQEDKGSNLEYQEYY
jgi:hypothetical protein